MEPVVLTRDVLFDMPVDDLWQFVADPDGLCLWLGDSVDLDVRPGGVGTVRDDGHADDDSNDNDGDIDNDNDERDSDDRGGSGSGRGSGSDGIVVRHVRVDRVEPAHELAFTWWRRDDPHMASQVVFQLTPVPGGSRLLITETLLISPVPPGGMTATAHAGTGRDRVGDAGAVVVGVLGRNRARVR